MNIRDMVKVQKKNQLFRNCALVLRYVPRELLFNDREDEHPELTLDLERQLIHEEDWKDASGCESKKELDVIHACMDVAKVIEIHKDDKNELIAINWGYAKVNANSVDILANGAVAITGDSDSEISKAIEGAKALLEDAASDKVLLSNVLYKIETSAKNML